MSCRLLSESRHLQDGRKSFYNFKELFKALLFYFNVNSSANHTTLRFMKSIHITIVALLACMSLQAQKVQKNFTFTNLQEALDNAEEVIRLDLSNQTLDFSKVPFEQFKNLEYLSLKDDKLSSFPEAILELENLRILDLSGNDFERLPENFFQLQKIEELYLNNDQKLNVERTVLQLSKLPNLSSLHLEGDRIKKLPSEMVNLKKLKFLYLTNNELEDIPLFLMDLEQLKFLDIQDNAIPKIKIQEYDPKGNIEVKF